MIYSPATFHSQLPGRLIKLGNVPASSPWRPLFPLRSPIPTVLSSSSSSGFIVSSGFARVENPNAILPEFGDLFRWPVVFRHVARARKTRKGQEVWCVLVKFN